MLVASSHGQLLLHRVRSLGTILCCRQCRCLGESLECRRYGVPADIWSIRVRLLLAACCCCYLHHAHSCCSWPIRTLSFSCDSSFIASASEDLVIDIVRRVDLVVSDVPCSTLMHAICSSVTRRDWRVGLSDCMQGRNEHGRVASIESVARVRRR